MSRCPRTWLAVAALLGWGHLCGGLGCGAGAADARPAPPGPAAGFDELGFTQFRGAEPVLRVRAHRLRVIPRQVGAFQLGPLQEAILSRVRCELYGHPVAGAPSGPPSFPRGGLERLGLGGASWNVVALSIHELECSLVREGTPAARLTATRAELSGASGALALHGLVLRRLPGGPVLRAESATWNPALDTVVVRGPYELTEGAAVRRGRGLRADLELRRTEPAGPGP